MYLDENNLSKILIGLAIDVHKTLGPGLMETAYQECLFYEISKAGLIVQKEKAIPIFYDGVKLTCNYRIDLLVENKVVIETKCIESINDIHLAQTLTYLKLGGFKLGLLINFNVVLLKQGIRRIANNL
jgi:GxxExxY protein